MRAYFCKRKGTQTARRICKEGVLEGGGGGGRKGDGGIAAGGKEVTKVGRKKGVNGCYAHRPGDDALRLRRHLSRAASGDGWEEPECLVSG